MTDRTRGEPRIAFIGGGRMAEAMIRGLLLKQVVRNADITVCEIATERIEHLRQVLGVETTIDPETAVTDATVVVLAIKPQQMAGVSSRLRGRLPRDAVVISIVAGARMDGIAEALEHASIVRAIPNTPARVGMSSTVWCCTSETDADQRERANDILNAIGLSMQVAAEDYVEIATGLTAPTPAFVFLIIESLVDAGVRLGLPVEKSLELTLQTIHGSVVLMKETGEHAAVLRSQVTSPGGATAAGLHVLERAALRATLSDAVRAVFDRAKELGPLSDPTGGRRESGKR